MVSEREHPMKTFTMFLTLLAAVTAAYGQSAGTLQSRLEELQLRQNLLEKVRDAGLPVANGSTDPSAIKGHVLGETLTEYLQRNASDSNYYNMCRDKLIKHPKDKPCNAFVAVIQDPSGNLEVHGGYDCDTYTFNQGRLIRMDIYLVSEFAPVEADMIRRFGEPAKRDERVMQNGFGATFHYPKSAWITSTIGAILEDKSNTVDGMRMSAVDLTISTKTAIDKQLQYQATHAVDTLK